MPMTLTDATTSARRCESWKNVGPCSVRGLGERRSSACSIGVRCRKRRHVLAVLDDGAQLRPTFRREQQRLRARADDAVAALELAAIDGEVGLVDELVRVGAVFREARDAERNRRADRLCRRLDLELTLGDRAADALRDLHRLLGRRLREENRELLAAEAGRHVVVPELCVEDLRDALQDRVACEVAVAVVDVAEQVEVGHDQRHRALEARGTRELCSKRCREVARVVEARLRIDARLRLELRNAERAVDDDERRECGEDQPRVPVPEGRERDTENRQHDVDRDRLDAEETALAEAVAAAQLHDDRDEHMVHGDEGDCSGEPGDGEPSVGIPDHALAVVIHEIGDPPRSERSRACSSRC